MSDDRRDAGSKTQSIDRATSALPIQFTATVVAWPDEGQRITIEVEPDCHEYPRIGEPVVVLRRATPAAAPELREALDQALAIEARVRGVSIQTVRLETGLETVVSNVGSPDDWTNINARFLSTNRTPDPKAAALAEALDAADRRWFHAAHGLHDDAHHQHHDPMAVCVPLILVTNDLRAALTAALDQGESA